MLDNEKIMGQLLAVLREGYEGPPTPWSYFTDAREDAGLLGVLKPLSSREVSRTVAGQSIVAHLHHVAFGMNAAADWIRGDHTPKEWKESWSETAPFGRMKVRLKREIVSMGQPDIDPKAWVADAAHVIGKVRLAAGSSIWFGAVLRGDNALISVGENSNIQEGAILHTDPGLELIVGPGCTVGHQAMLHGCTVRKNALVGLGSIVMDGCVLEENSMLAAGGMLTPGKRIGPNELWAGSPARLLRVMDEAEQKRFARNAQVYRDLARQFRSGLKSVG